MARWFARDGARVVLADVDGAAGQALAAEIDGLAVLTDVTRERDNQALVGAARPDEPGRVAGHRCLASG